MSKGSKRAGWIVAAGAAASALLGLGYVVTTWCRYGRVADDGTVATSICSGGSP